VSKISGGVAAASLPGDAETVAVIVKVAEPGYVPPGFRVRARIDERLFTAECDGASLRRVESDANVVSVSLARRLQQSS
jgi:hypothetical protein